MATQSPCLICVLHFEHKEVMPEKGIHTASICLLAHARPHSTVTAFEIIDNSPMGCRASFYMSLIGAWRTAACCRRTESGDGGCAESAGSKPDPGAERFTSAVRIRCTRSGEAGHCPSYSGRDVRVNSNKELALPKEKLRTAYLVLLMKAFPVFKLTRFYGGVLFLI